MGIKFIKMSSKRYAVIDVGSNSVRLMQSLGNKTLSKQIIITKLSEGLGETSMLCNKAMERTAQAICFFYNKAKEDGADEVYAFATAAVRKAVNGLKFTEKVKNTCGLDIEVVSGEKEAELGVLGALGKNDGYVVDIGGASTEISVYKDGKIIYSKSIYLGCVNTTDKCGQDEQVIKKYVREKLKEFGDVVRLPLAVYGIGGTATTIAGVFLNLEVYDPKIVHGTKLSKEDIEKTKKLLLSLSIEDRKKLKSLQKDRAEVIGPGSLILSEIVNFLGATEIIISENDNLEGYLEQKLNGKI